MPITQPPISDNTLLTTVRAAYGVAAKGIEFLPLGYDLDAGVYRVTAADGGVYFLKAKAVPFAPASLAVPRLLYASGLTQVVAPMPTLDGGLIAHAGSFSLALYPFIDGREGWHGLTPSQWVEFGAVMRKIHAAQLPPDLPLERESFAPQANWRDLAHQTHASILTREGADPEQRALIAAWRTHYDAISTILRRADELGKKLKAQNPPLVLCHADLHTGNLLIDGDGRLFVVDWDQPVYALKERDLMMVMKGIGMGGRTISDEEQALFFTGYGITEVDFMALTYYRCAWVTQDIGSFAEQLFLLPDLSVEAKQQAVHYFNVTFSPVGSAPPALEFAY